PLPSPVPPPPPSSPKTRSRSSPTPPSLPPTPVPPAIGSSSALILVECYQQGKAVKVRAISPGYHLDWNVQFPRELRQAGLRYQVTALQESKQGGFYRAVGPIVPYL
ncbi:MAG: hypothetical protein SFW36_08305, partial [Leptolyngbyaceae cyanobacterium bins.59]|nr:hypothetical protein [Leptolyngbyaceae cyanobacterium bins.59]